MNLMLPINLTSYGLIGYQLIKNWETPCSLFPIHSMKDIMLEPGADTAFLKAALEKAEIWEPSKPCLKLWHQHGMDIFPTCSERIGFPIFELDEFSYKEQHHLQNLDTIIVASEWAKEVVLSHTKLKHKKVHVVNLGTDTSIYNSNYTHTPNKEYTFLNIGKLEVRKGHDILVDIFEKAFDIYDNVKLKILCHNFFLPKEEILRYESLFKNSKLASKIEIVNRLATQKEVADLIKSCDAYIAPSRAEGWNMPLYDAIACGKPVITTNCTAHREYCNKNNSFLVDVPHTTLAYDGFFFKNYIGSWASIEEKQINEFAEYMRYCYNNKIYSLEKSEVTPWKTVVKKLKTVI